jgi:cytochrome c-type biogenesis protein CcmF
VRSLILALALVVLAPPALVHAQEAHVEEPGSAEGIATAPEVAQRLFKDLVCMCGGCQRLPLWTCRCAFAKEERAKVMGLLAGRDLSTPEGEEQAYLTVRDAFMKEYGGQRVLTVPLETGFNRLGFIIPATVVGLALIVVIMVGIRWVRRGRERAALAAAAAPPLTPPVKTAADEDLEDRLDDELREID